MSEPFRETLYPCPSCGVGLQELDTRLVCDACGGALLTREDLSRSIAEIALRAVELSFSREKPTSQACPRCGDPLTKCRVEVVKLAKLRVDLLRCERDGVWFPGEMLAKLFARVGRRVLRIGAGPSPGAAGDGGAGGGGAADRVGLFRRRREEPGEITPFVSLYRDQRLRCPVCDDDRALRLDGDRWTCDDCAGVFLENAALEAMMSEMTHEPWMFPGPVTSEECSTRPCPVCAKRLWEAALEGATVDVCALHGVWFDFDELADALAAAGGAAPRAGWIRRLLARI